MVAVGLIAGGPPLGVAFGLRPLGDIDIGRRSVVRQDVLLWALIGGVTTLSLGLPQTLAGVMPSGLGWGLVQGMLGGLTIALSCGVAGQITIRRLVLALVLRRRENLPLRLGHFLDWCGKAGIMRMAGGTYAFRQETLREWFRSPAQSENPSGIDPMSVDLRDQTRVT